MTIVAFNGQTFTPESINGACFEQLLNVTAGNKRHLKNFLSGKGTGEGTSYLKALTKAFEIFQNTPTNDEDKGKCINILTYGYLHTFITLLHIYIENLGKYCPRF